MRRRLNWADVPMVGLALIAGWRGLGDVALIAAVFMCAYMSGRIDEGRLAPPPADRVAFYLATRGRCFTLDIAEGTRLSAGTVSVALAQLERDGRVVSGWAEPLPGHTLRRRWYTLANG